MTAFFKFLAAVAVALELITDQIKKYVAKKDKIESQKRYDDIERDPIGYGMRKFKRTEPPSKKTSSPEPGKPGGK